VECHNSFALNSGDGSFVLSGPDTYTPGGDPITISVALADQGQLRWGFEATVLDGSNLPVGNIVVTNMTHTQLSVAVNARQYVKHQSAGTFAGTPDQSPGWSFDWEPPVEDAGPVTFYAAGNAANNNLSNQGDFIYTTSLTVNPADPAPCCGAFDPEGLSGNFDYDPENFKDISDILMLARYSLLGGEPGPCLAEGNTDGDPECFLDISDILRLARFSLLGGAAPAPCVAACE
jgi:hypothetical protein